MAKLEQNIRKEIAENLDCGYRCYYNPKNNELITIPDDSNFYEDEFEEAFQADLDRVHDLEEDFIVFEVLESFESFKIMEQFVDQMTDQHFKNRLEDTLGSKKPFQNFNVLIKNSEYRQHWYDFKQKALEKIVKNRLDVWKANSILHVNFEERTLYRE